MYNKNNEITMEKKKQEDWFRLFEKERPMTRLQWFMLAQQVELPKIDLEQEDPNSNLK